MQQIPRIAAGQSDSMLAEFVDEAIITFDGGT